MGYKQRLLVFLALFTLIGSAGLYLANSLKDKVQQDVEREVEGVQDITTVPKITNLAPIEAFVGQEYRYDVEVVDQDTPTGDLQLAITQGPSWLFKSGLSLYGTPSNFDIGTHNVSFTISDGENTVMSEFYIVVSSSDEVGN